MRRVSRWLAGALVVALSATPGFMPQVGGEEGLTLRGGEAFAQRPYAQTRRVARRTSRRTARRQSYLRSLPAGCVRRGGYWYCGGVYYQSVVQDGATVYVVVNP